MIDIFSSKFDFYVKDKRTRKKETTIGKFTTILISLISLGFLGYQIERMESSKMLPKIT